ncbi:hypothetical protein [Actinocorallia aurantiaca]|uniref:Uncharacterized protein n=1 Tax=Actinocorallia aurantiaca TaxID=46204 RepID=A0ABN3U403_9ACTN
MSRKLTLAKLPVSLGAYALFFRIPAGLNVLGALMLLFQALLFLLFFLG